MRGKERLMSMLTVLLMRRRGHQSGHFRSLFFFICLNFHFVSKYLLSLNYFRSSASLKQFINFLGVSNREFSVPKSPIKTYSFTFSLSLTLTCFSASLQALHHQNLHTKVNAFVFLNRSRFHEYIFFFYNGLAHPPLFPPQPFPRLASWLPNLLCGFSLCPTILPVVSRKGYDDPLRKGYLKF